MGYKIQYSGSVKLERAKKGLYYQHMRIPVVLVIALLFAVLLFFFKEDISTIMFPGNADVTMEAFSEFVEDIHSGEGVKEAFVSFCMEIIESAEV